MHALVINQEQQELLKLQKLVFQQELPKVQQIGQQILITALLL